MSGHRASGDPVRVLFVGGMGRSGSTLMARALGQVPGLVTVGELHYLWDQGVLADRLCSCGDPFSACPFWQEVGSHLDDGWSDDHARRMLDIRRSRVRNRNVPWLGLERLPERVQAERDEYAAAMAEVLAAVARVADARAVVDTSKYPSSAFVLRSCDAVDLRLVHLVRRSEGVAWSWMKKVQRLDRDGGEFARFPPSRSAVEWLAYNAAYEALRAAGVPGCVVRYEDFVADPRATVSDLLARMDLAVPDDDLDFLHEGGIDLRPHHSLAGNPMRFRVGTEAIRVDDAWATDMPAATRRLVAGISAPGLLRYGYLQARR